MERKIGEIFEFGGEWYQCIIGHCNQCSFDEAGTCKFIGNPYCAYRNDKKLACFKKLEKVGETYEKRVSDGTFSTFQRYKVYNSVILPKKPYMYCNFIDNTIEIEIKQNKEDMEDLDKIKVRDYTKVEELNVMEEKKLNLKPFDIQKAREGKPVCTRDGHKARIICFDYNGETGDYPIVALVHYNKGNKCYERVLKYTSDGLFNKYGDCQHDDDLMMLPENKEGWVNIYNRYSAELTSDGYFYFTKEEALSNIENDGTYVKTIKTSWEE